MELSRIISQRISMMIRWIDTSTMICDPLTKAGPQGFASRLQDCMCTGNLSLEPTVESQMKKLQQQKRRRERAEENEAIRQGERGQGMKKKSQILLIRLASLLGYARFFSVTVGTKK